MYDFQGFLDKYFEKYKNHAQKVVDFFQERKAHAWTSAQACAKIRPWTSYLLK